MSYLYQLFHTVNIEINSFHIFFPFFPSIQLKSSYIFYIVIKKTTFNNSNVKSRYLFPIKSDLIVCKNFKLVKKLGTGAFG